MALGVTSSWWSAIAQGLAQGPRRASCDPQMQIFFGVIFKQSDGHEDTYMAGLETCSPPHYEHVDKEVTPFGPVSTCA